MFAGCLLLSVIRAEYKMKQNNSFKRYSKDKYVRKSCTYTKAPFKTKRYVKSMNGETLPFYVYSKLANLYIECKRFIPLKVNQLL